MKVLVGVTLAMLVASCGDNSKECGPGTTDDQGVCTPVASCGTGTKDDGTGTCVPSGTVVCTGGTIFDAATGTCQIDPAACQDGTVLVGAACVDPTAGLVVDVEEGAEPNGLGVLGEKSAAPAGLVAIKASGATVIHGKIVPFDHDGDGRRDADVDAYLFTTTGPVFLHVTADGVHGLAAGFVVFASDRTSPDPLATWQRLGVNLTGDAAHRDVYVPAAGTYLLAIADSRSLVLGASPAGADPNAPAFEYFVSITPQAVPAPTPLTLTNGKIVVTGTLDPGGVRFYTAQLGTGFSDVLLEAPPDTYGPTDSINAGVVVMANGGFRNTASERQVQIFGSSFTVPAEVVEGGLTSADAVLIVADAEYDWNLDPTPFRLTVATSDGLPLAANGAVTQTLHTVTPSSPYLGLDWFYFDTTTAGQTVGLQLAFDAPVDMVLLDEHFRIIAPFTWLSGQPSGNTMTGYTGLLRLPLSGRYYFGVYAPGGTVGTTKITATSKLTAMALDAVTVDAPLTRSIDPAYGARAFTFDAGATPWLAFGASGTGTGPIDVAYYAADAAFGRLDPVDITTTSTLSFPPDPTPVFAHRYPQAGDAVPRIVLDDPSPQYYVHVRPATPGDVTLDIARRAFTDLGTLAPPATTTRSDSVPATTGVQRYLVRTATDNRATLTLHPTGPTAAAANLELDLLAADETTRAAFTAIGGDVTATVFQTGRGWTAFEIANHAASAQPYDLTVAIAAPVTYAVAASTTAFSDACAGGTTVPLADDDEAVSAPIAAPPGFVFFGAPAPSFVVSTNGWLSFDTTASDATYANTPLPTADALNALIAPYWDDLHLVTVCTKAIGARLVVQWTGAVFGANTSVQFQAILDGATGAIELVYGPQQAAHGAGAIVGADPGATIGIEDPAGLSATQLGFEANVVTASSATKFTPN